MPSQKLSNVTRVIEMRSQKSLPSLESRAPRRVQPERLSVAATKRVEHLRISFAAVRCAEFHLIRNHLCQLKDINGAYAVEMRSQKNLGSCESRAPLDGYNRKE